MFDGGLLHGLIWTVLVLIVWDMFWRGLALWKAARRGDTWWFLAILVLNTLGILPLLYWFLAKDKQVTSVVRGVKKVGKKK